VSALRILVADDHEVVRRGIRALLEHEAGWTVCGEAANGREAVEQALALKPDVVVLDLAMPELNGLEATRRILKEVPGVEVLVLTMHDTPVMVRQLLEAGARGFVLKSDAGRSLVAAVNSVAHRRPFFSPSVTEIVVGGFLDRPGSDGGAGRRDPLTPREREVVQLLAEGRTNKEVAAILGISVKTADTHRTRIMRKLGAHSVVDLVRYAIRTGIARP